VTAKFGTKVWSLLLGMALPVVLVAGCNTEEPTPPPAAGPAVKAPVGGAGGGAPGKPADAGKPLTPGGTDTKKP
jgi:hypothetical protein